MTPDLHPAAAEAAITAGPREVVAARIPAGCLVHLTWPGRRDPVTDAAPCDRTQWWLVPGSGLPWFTPFILDDPDEITAYANTADQAIWDDVFRRVTGPGTGPVIVHVAYHPGSRTQDGCPAAFSIREDIQ